MTSRSNYGPIFWSIVALFIVFVLFSEPFLRIPYDPWHHLQVISSIFHHGEVFLSYPEQTTGQPTSWNYVWAYIFKFLQISDPMVWAKVIYRVQFFLIGLLVFLASRIFLTELLRASRKHINLLALLATFFWLIGNGTKSMAFQQAWILWYGMGYQITLPIVFYLNALIFRETFGKVPHTKIQTLQTVGIVLFGAFITARFHSAELAYLCLFGLFCMLFKWRELLAFAQRRPLLCALCLIGAPLFVYFTVSEVSILIDTLTREGTIVQKIVSFTDLIKRHLNRFPSAYSEIGVFGVLAPLVLLKFSRYRNRAFGVVLAYSAFSFFAPIVPFLNGAIHIVLVNTTWRLTLSSLWFVSLAIVVYEIANKFPLARVPSIVRPLAYGFTFSVLVTIASRKVFYETTYHNVKSILNGLDWEKVGHQFSDSDIAFLEKNVHSKVAGRRGSKTPMLFMRGDAGLVAGVFFNHHVFQKRRQVLKRKVFNRSKMPEKYDLVEIPLPGDFTRDPLAFQYFNLETVFNDE